MLLFGRGLFHILQDQGNFSGGFLQVLDQLHRFRQVHGTDPLGQLSRGIRLIIIKESHELSPRFLLDIFILYSFNIDFIHELSRVKTWAKEFSIRGWKEVMCRRCW